MKPSGIVSFLTALALVLMQPMPAAAWASLLVGMTGTIGVISTSRFFNVRTNAVMMGWSLDAIPDDYPKIRDTWDRVHTIRATCGVTAFCGYALAALLR
jgi:hypothetical protein